MTIWSLPEDGKAQNLYGVLSTRHLEALGVNVVPRPYRHLFAWPALLRPPEVLHFSFITPWILPYEWKPAVPAALAKGGLFLLQILALRLRGVRIVWTVHTLVNHELRHARIERFFGRLFAHCAHVLAVHGEAARAAVIREFHLDRHPEKVHALPHPNYLGAYPDTATRESARAWLGCAPEKLVLLCLGQIRPYKNLPEVLTTYMGTFPPEAGLELWIAGESIAPQVAEKLEQLAADRPDVHLRFGHVPDEHLQYYLRACDFMVLNYADLPISGAAVLAMSFGCAVIAPHAGGLREILDPAGTIFFEAGLAEALRSARDRKTEAPAMGRHNRDRAAAWSWEKAARQFLQWFSAP